MLKLSILRFSKQNIDQIIVLFFLKIHFLTFNYKYCLFALTYVVNYLS